MECVGKIALLLHHHNEFEAGVVEDDKEDDDGFGCVSIYWLAVAVELRTIG